MNPVSSKTITTDVIVIGSGIAALHFIRTLNGKRKVQLLTKTSLRDSNSYRAQGGVAAVVGQTQDSFELHAQDTLAAGEYHHNPAAVTALVHDGAREVERLIADGFAVDTDAEGRPERGLEGAHSRPRVIHAGGDATGENLIEFSLANLPGALTLNEGHTVFELIVEHERCVGVRSHDPQGEVCTFYASVVVLATGGVGQLYRYSTAAPTVTGDGLALAYLAGARLADMEFVQFHPTLLYAHDTACGLLSEAIRGEGGILVNQRGERIMADYPLQDLSPRHLTAHRIFTCREQGDEVFLDIRSVADFPRHFPTATRLCHEHGVDIQQGLLPVTPGCHFLMGGVLTDLHGRTSVPGLYAIGEVAYTGVHGANRLASNSLLEALAFAQRLAQHVLATPLSEKTISDIPRLPAQPYPALLQIDELKALMMRDAGIIRTREGLRQAQALLPDPHTMNPQDLGQFSKQAVERYLMNLTAALIVGSALNRPESRGAHVLSDCPQADPAWGTRRLVWYNRALITEEIV